MGGLCGVSGTELLLEVRWPDPRLPPGVRPAAPLRPPLPAPIEPLMHRPTPPRRSQSASATCCGRPPAPSPAPPSFSRPICMPRCALRRHTRTTYKTRTSAPLDCMAASWTIPPLLTIRSATRRSPTTPGGCTTPQKLSRGQSTRAAQTEHNFRFGREASPKKAVEVQVQSGETIASNDNSPSVLVQALTRYSRKTSAPITRCGSSDAQLEQMVQLGSQRV